MDVTIEYEKLKDEFVAEACALLRDTLGDDFHVEQSSVTKLNGVRKQTIVIRTEDREYAPSFYVDELYASYQRGTPMEQLMDEIAGTARKEHLGCTINQDEIFTRPWIEQNMYLQLLNKEKNKELLDSSIYVDVVDLAAVFYVLVERGEDQIRSFRMPKGLWEEMRFGAPQDWYESALLNTERLFPSEIRDLEACIRETLEEGRVIGELKTEEEMNVLGRSFLYVVTNHRRTNGAIVVLYPDFLKKAEERLGPFFLIPSSIHEMLILPRKREADSEELNEMVKEVNTSQVIPEEILSNHVYFYSEKTGLIAS